MMYQAYRYHAKRYSLYIKLSIKICVPLNYNNDLEF